MGEVLHSLTSVRLARAFVVGSIVSISMAFALPMAVHAQQSPQSPVKSSETGVASQPVQAATQATTQAKPGAETTNLEERANAAAARLSGPAPRNTDGASNIDRPEPGQVETPKAQANVEAKDQPSVIAKPIQRSVSQTPPKQVEPEQVVKEAAKPKEATLVVSSWSGAYGDAQRRAIIAPVARDLGMKIERRSRANESSNVAAVDVTELDQSSLMEACRAGRVLKLGEIAGNLDGQDFFVAQKGRCGVPTFAWSSMIIANGEAMKKLARSRYRVPGKLSHLLDTKGYPGKRALIREPKRLIEMVLLADGVAREQLYVRLSTRQGQDQAFELLDKLSKNIVWVDGSREALEALDAGQATFAMTYSGRAFRRLIASRLLPIWDGHIIDYASWAVSAKSRQPDAARRFILAATTAESLAAQARLWPYGPMRRSALPLARRHDLLDTELDPFMPTSDLRFSQGVVLDAAFWAEHGEALRRRFVDWQDGIPLGIRVPVPRKAPPPPTPPIPRRAG